MTSRSPGSYSPSRIDWRIVSYAWSALEVGAPGPLWRFRGSSLGRRIVMVYSKVRGLRAGYAGAIELDTGSYMILRRSARGLDRHSRSLLGPAAEIAETAPFAVLLVGLHVALGAQFGHRQVQPEIGRQTVGDVDVLAHQRQPERIIEGAREDALADVVGGDPRSGGRLVEHGVHGHRVQSGGDAERKSLERGLERHRRDRVVDRLHHVAGTEWTEVEHGATQHFEQRAGPGDVVWRPPHHEHQFRRLRAPLRT